MVHMSFIGKWEKMACAFQSCFLPQALRCVSYFAARSQPFPSIFDLLLCDGETAILRCGAKRAGPFIPPRREGTTRELYLKQASQIWAESASTNDEPARMRRLRRLFLNQFQAGVMTSPRFGGFMNQFKGLTT